MAEEHTQTVEEFITESMSQEDDSGSDHEDTSASEVVGPLIKGKKATKARSVMCSHSSSVVYTNHPPPRIQPDCMLGVVNLPTTMHTMRRLYDWILHRVSASIKGVKGVKKTVTTKKRVQPRPYKGMTPEKLAETVALLEDRIEVADNRLKTYTIRLRKLSAEVAFRSCATPST
jgi:hypothetical protein